MIITCNNCNKQFNINSAVIPDKGRLLQCSGCNYKWFFKKKIIIEPVETVKINSNVTEIEHAETIKTNPNITQVETVKKDSFETMELLDRINKNVSTIEEKITKHGIKKEIDSELKTAPLKTKKNYNIFGKITVFIITFIALIIILDTFQKPIGKIVPNIEFLLYNLYESIKDILLFSKDLI